VLAIDRLTRDPDALDGLPCDVALDSEAGDFPERLREAAGPAGVHCVVDNLGIGALWDAYQPALARSGRVIVSGAISHEPISIRLLPFYLHSQALIGVRTGNQACRDDLWRAVEAGFRVPEAFLKPQPWVTAAAAHQAVEEGRAHGQIVLEIP
jgi:NADPH:quinone reductase-like Zn-dependent oxidoreductase